MVLPPFVGPELGTALQLELIDHAVPGVVVTAAAGGLLGWPRLPQMALFAGGLVVTLAGLWATATHVPLVVQVGGQVDWVPAIHHFLPGPVVLLLGAGWAWRYR